MAINGAMYIDTSLFTVKKEIKDRRNLVGYIGRLSRSKGILNFVRAMPIFKKLYNFTGGEYPVAEGLCGRHICLPVFARMTEEEARYVVDSLRMVIQ